jgi:hypothetical protein
MKPKSKKIDIGADFIKKELDIYSDWTTRIFVEYLQNAIDAAASLIHFDFERVNSENGSLTRLTVTDNGVGMSLKVLEDVYFSLGKSQKDSPDAIGGFGRARAITQYAHSHWTVASKGYLATGAYVSYDVERGAALGPRKGCVFSVDIDRSVSEMVNNLTSVLKSSGIDAGLVSATVYGSPVIFDPPVIGELLHSYAEVDQDVDLATVEIRRSDDRTPMNIVRVRGLTMFESRNYDGQTTNIMNLNPALARDMLTATRDGWRGNKSHLITSGVRKALPQFNTPKLETHTVLHCANADLSEDEQAFIQSKYAEADSSVVCELDDTDAGAISIGRRFKLSLANEDSGSNQTPIKVRFQLDQIEHAIRSIMSDMVGYQKHDDRLDYSPLIPFPFAFCDLLAPLQAAPENWDVANRRFNPNSWNYVLGHDQAVEPLQSMALAFAWTRALHIAHGAETLASESKKEKLWTPGFVLSYDKTDTAQRFSSDPNKTVRYFLDVLHIPSLKAGRLSSTPRSAGDSFEIDTALATWLLHHALDSVLNHGWEISKASIARSTIDFSKEAKRIVAIAAECSVETMALAA